MNPTSQEYFDTANGLMGRGQMGQMNFFLFTIFYADKYGDKCYNQIVTTKPLQMGIVQKFKGDILFSMNEKLQVIFFNIQFSNR